MVPNVHRPQEARRDEGDGVSVEELRRQLLEGWDGVPSGLHLDCGDYVNASCADCAAKLDRLILEVQAEMPCVKVGGTFSASVWCDCKACFARTFLALDLMNRITA